LQLLRLYGLFFSYFETYKTMRSITGLGAGNGPYMSIHDFGLTWAGFLTGSDRIALDTHPYVAFNGETFTDPIATGTGAGAGGTWPARACGWGKGINGTQTLFGVTVAGEFSNAINDCGLFVKAAGIATTYGGNCADWEDASKWDDATKAGLKAWAMASMDATQSWFFWTWKVGFLFVVCIVFPTFLMARRNQVANSTAGHVQAPLWSYQLGLQGGWMPTDPREASGICAARGVAQDTPFDGNYLPWQTGGAGAGTIASSAAASVLPWPPASINGQANAALLPTYTSTGTIATLPPPTFTPSPTGSIHVGDGWFNSADTAGGITTVQGCSYPNPWSAENVPVPTACSGGAAAAAVAVITPKPKL
jgi:glucan 1,3-beta-glucosidase